MNDPRAANIYVSNCFLLLPSTAVPLVQDSMPFRFLCELKKFASVSSHISSHGNTLEKFLYYNTLCIHGISFYGSKLVMKLTGSFIKRFYHLT